MSPKDESKVAGERFSRATVRFGVPDIRAAKDFYSRLLERLPDFEPHADFIEWELFTGFWLQLGEGEPRPAYPLRLCVDDLDAEIRRVERELGARCSSIGRVPGLVAFCIFADPWGNQLGFYQRLYRAEAPVIGGSYHDYDIQARREARVSFCPARP